MYLVWIQAFLIRNLLSHHSLQWGVPCSVPTTKAFLAHFFWCVSGGVATSAISSWDMNTILTPVDVSKAPSIIWTTWLPPCSGWAGFPRFGGPLSPYIWSIIECSGIDVPENVQQPLVTSAPNEAVPQNIIHRYLLKSRSRCSLYILVVNNATERK